MYTTMLDKFKKKYPDLPWNGPVWDWVMVSPMSLEDQAECILFISFGKKAPKRPKGYNQYSKYWQHRLILNF